MKKSKVHVILIALFFLSANAFSQKDTTKKAEFVPSGKLWGYAFGDFIYKPNANSFGQTTAQYANIKNYPKDFTNFEFRRIYLGYDYNINEKFSTQFLLAYEGTLLSDNLTRTMYLKYANLRWKNIFHNSDLVMGAQSTPTFATTSEPVWGYRSLEKTIMDMRGIGGSSDVGVSLQGTLNDEGTFGYNLMIGNGTGQKISTSKFKKFYGDVYVKLLDKKLLIDLGADDLWSQDKPYIKSKSTFKAFVAYQTKGFTVGVEGFEQVQKNYDIYKTSPTSVNDTANAVASGISIFTHGAITKKLGFVARYDHYNPDTKYNNSYTWVSTANMYTESFLLAGLDYSAAKNVHIMPNIWYDNYKNNGKTGTKNSDDLVARITLYYIFK